MYSFTSEDLIQYIYNETSIQKTAAIKAALETDWILKESYDEIILAQSALKKINLSPRKQVVDKILAYAEKSLRHSTTEA